MFYFLYYVFTRKVNFLHLLQPEQFLKKKKLFNLKPSTRLNIAHPSFIMFPPILHLLKIKFILHFLSLSLFFKHILQVSCSGSLFFFSVYVIKCNIPFHLKSWRYHAMQRWPQYMCWLNVLSRHLEFFILYHFKDLQRKPMFHQTPLHWFQCAHNRSWKHGTEMLINTLM